VGVVPVVGVGFMGVWDVLVECASSGKGEHLHAEADREDWDVRAVVELGDELDFVGLSGLKDGCGLGVVWRAKCGGDWVVAS